MSGAKIERSASEDREKWEEPDMDCPAGITIGRYHHDVVAVTEKIDGWSELVQTYRDLKVGIGSRCPQCGYTLTGKE